MDESVTKGMKLLSLDAALALPDSCEISCISVTGYDTEIPPDALESTLRKHFGSCGVITDVYIPVKQFRFANVYFLGEGALDKALQLDGSDLGGWNVSVSAEPIEMEMYSQHPSLRVDGIDPSLSENDINAALTKLFSSFYRLFKIVHFKGSALLSLGGLNATAKARELKGGYIGERKITIRLLSGPHAQFPKKGGARLRRHPLFARDNQA